MERFILLKDKHKYENNDTHYLKFNINSNKIENLIICKLDTHEIVNNVEQENFYISDSSNIDEPNNIIKRYYPYKNLDDKLDDLVDDTNRPLYGKDTIGSKNTNFESEPNHDHDIRNSTNEPINNNYKGAIDDSIRFTKYFKKQTNFPNRAEYKLNINNIDNIDNIKHFSIKRYLIVENIIIKFESKEDDFGKCINIQNNIFKNGSNLINTTIDDKEIIVKKDNINCKLIINHNNSQLFYLEFKFVKDYITIIKNGSTNLNIIKYLESKRTNNIKFNYNNCSSEKWQNNQNCEPINPDDIDIIKRYYDIINNFRNYFLIPKEIRLNSIFSDLFSEYSKIMFNLVIYNENVIFEFDKFNIQLKINEEFNKIDTTNKSLTFENLNHINSEDIWVPRPILNYEKIQHKYHLTNNGNELKKISNTKIKFRADNEFSEIKIQNLDKGNQNKLYYNDQYSNFMNI